MNHGQLYEDIALVIIAAKWTHTIGYYFEKMVGGAYAGIFMNFKIALNIHFLETFRFILG